MLHYKIFTLNPVEENCYILWDDVSMEGAIIDCGAWNEVECKRISDFITAEGINLKYSWQTHMHFDHCMGLGFIKNTYGITPMCHALDIPVYKNAPDMVKRWFRMDISDSMVDVEPAISENSVLSLGNIGIQVLHTPGHTQGGVCYYIPEARVVFTGDTLFCGSIGRTDLPGGNFEQEIMSIKNKLLTLPEDTKVLPGHGSESSIHQEMLYNAYF